jgi:hypothetical protein
MNEICEGLYAIEDGGYFILRTETLCLDTK